MGRCAMLDAEQISRYQQQGYLTLPGAIAESEIQRLEAGLARNPPLDGTLDSTLTYPEPGRYTLANNAFKDPDLGFIVEHPAILEPVRSLLGDEPRLTAYVIYDRTPGGAGIPGHNDYKRWRPVGSSMNWLFTIVPFCDFNAETGRLWVAPGSHHPERARPGANGAMEVEPPVRPAADAYVDPGVGRGDLLLMNMYLWHRADGNESDLHRTGLFNKYAAASAPPATGYFLYDEAAVAGLSSAGRDLIAVHDDRPIASTRLVLGRERGQDFEVLVRGEDQNWTLPGGPTFIERAIPDWDEGNVVAALQHNLREQLGIEPPWVSYVGDYVEGDHLCRVYGYTLNGQGFPVPYDGQWMAPADLTQAQGQFGYESDAVRAWLDPDVVRGKAITQAQSRVDQYAF